MGIAAAGFAEDPTSTDNIDDYREQTKRIMTGMFELLDQNPQSMQLFHSQSQMIDGTAMQRSFEAYSDFTARFLVNGVKKGFLRANLDIDTTAQALVGLIFEGTRRAVAEDAPRETWERWIDAGVALMFEASRPDRYKMDFWEFLRYLHVLAVTFFVGGQLVLVAAVVPVLRGAEDPEPMRHIARKFGYGRSLLSRS